VIYNSTSFWQSHWGYFIYGVLSVLLVLVGVYVLYTIYRLKHKMRLEKQQLETESNLYAQQNRFEPKQPQVNSRDEEFMQKVMHEIEQNMDNDSYSIDTMASTIGVSRTLLLKKIKGLTGQTPVEFIRNIKLQRAAQLLTTRQMSVKEVMYMVSMNDAKYFRECFRKKYGKTPSEYML